MRELLQRFFSIFLYALLIAIIAGLGWSALTTMVAFDAIQPIGIQGADSARIRLFFVGDTGSQDERENAVAEAMSRYCQANQGFNGIVLLGDNFYPAGVTSVDDPQWQKAVWGPFGKPCLDQLEIFPVLGNHDRRGSVSAQLQYSKENRRWRMPGRFYSVRFGSVIELAQLDSTRFDSWLPIPGGYVSILRNLLTESPAAWRIATTHHPYMSHCSKRPEREDPLKMASMRRHFCPLADIWMSGHVHLMERAEDQSLCSAPQFIVGSGGGELVSDSSCTSASSFHSSSHGFAVVDADRKSIRVQFIGLDGQILDEWKRQK